MTYKKDDRVRWDGGNESSVGTVRRKIITNAEAGRRWVCDEPQYLFESEKTGNTAVHHPAMLSKA